jgi:hypothetical protein
MPRIKSLVTTMRVTTAGNSHNCRNNEKHRIEKGTKRLTVDPDGDKHHYCLDCAKTFLEKDIEMMQGIFSFINGGAPQGIDKA